MSIIKEILRQVIRQASDKNGGSHEYYNHEDQNRSRVYEYENNNKPKSRSGGFLFFIVGVSSAIFFVLFGIYELLFRSPLASWTASIWRSIMKTSPQAIVELPNQIAGAESLMQKTVGDWLGLVPGSLGQIWAIIVSPASAVIGLILLFIAFGIRLGGKFFKRQQTNNNGSSIKIISWLILIGSFLPLLLEYIF